MNIRAKIEDELKILMKNHDVGGHGLDHFFAVANHAIKALEYETLSNENKCQVELAALLHDVDDRKIFPKSVNYQNARQILNKVCMDIEDKDNFIDKIIEMINLVSCSENGDSEPPIPWMAIPRDCDRLEAIGQIGIDRCKAFTIHNKSPFHLESTHRAYSLEEVMVCASPERFANYIREGKSLSMIDHYYDKLLHIGHPERLRSQNVYILNEATKRNNTMIEFVIQYWNNQKMEP